MREHGAIFISNANALALATAWMGKSALDAVRSLLQTTRQYEDDRAHVRFEGARRSRNNKMSPSGMWRVSSTRFKTAAPILASGDGRLEKKAPSSPRISRQPGAEGSSISTRDSLRKPANERGRSHNHRKHGQP